MKSYISMIFYILDPGSKKRLPLLVLMFLFTSMLDLIGIGLVGIFLAVMTNPKLIFDKIHFLQPYQHLLTKDQLFMVCGIAVVSAFIFKAIASLWVQGQIIKFSRNAGLNMQMRLMKGYQSVPYIFHLRHNSMQMLARMSQISSFVSSGLIPSITFISNALIFVCIISLLFISNFWATCSLFGIFATIFFLYDHVTKKKINDIGNTLAVSQSTLNKSISQGISGFKEVRILGTESYFLSKFKKVSRDCVTAQAIIGILQQVPRFVVENALVIFMISICLAAILSGSSPASVVVTAGIFAAAGTRLLPVVNQLIGMSSSLRSQFPVLQVISDELKEIENYKKKDHLALLIQDYLYTDKSNDFEKICLENIAFKYPVDDRPALDSINLSFKKGDSIGVIGPSGAGKSTLINVLLGLLPPTSGRILLDGKSITDLRSWLNHFAYIPQSIYLLDDTMSRNIAFGIEDNEVDEIKLRRAAEMAQLTNVIKDLPEGFDTLVGENGVRLSGGQRQRVALARAFYFDRDIIVMDEATSALDNETEREVIESIKRLKGNKTMIVIAHRLSTVEHCDVLYRLDHGRITKQGSYAEVVVA